MATLFYNNVLLEMQKTVNFLLEPVSDDTGVDHLYTHGYIEAICVWHPFATAAALNPTTGNDNKGIVPAVDAHGRPLVLPPIAENVAIQAFQGQPLPISINKLYEKLMERRKYMHLQIGNDGTEDSAIAIQAPQHNDFPDANLPCDANNGPVPRHCRIIQIMGDKSAIVSYGIDFWINKCNRMVLSNRWECRSTTTENGFSRRLIVGTAILRADFMQSPVLGDPKLTADAFRAAYFPGVPQQFKRDVVEAILSADGTRLTYTLLDRELALAIGNNQGIMQVKGGVKAGTKNDATQLEALVTTGAGNYAKNMWGNVNSFYRDLAHGNFRQAWGDVWNAYFYNPLADPAAPSIRSPSSFIPQNRASAHIEVYGNRSAQKYYMAQVAISVALERLLFQPGNQTPTIVSAFLSQSVDERIVTFDMEVIPPLSGFLAVVDDPVTGILALMKLENAVNWTTEPAAIDWKAGDPVTEVGPAIGGGAGQPSSDDRGTWLEALVKQALSSRCALPGAAPQTSDYQVSQELPLR